jgi:predicted transcriptional regulator
MTTNTPIISIREYGRRRGCSDTAVRKAINAGKIVEGVARDKRGKVLGIYEEVANAEWALNHDPMRERVTKNGEASERFLEAETKPAAPIGQGKPTGYSGAANENSLAAAKRAQAIYKAKLSELEYKQKAGKLVDKQEVYKQLYGAGQELRQAFQTIPDRFIDDILAASSRNESHQVLFNAIADVLEGLSEIEKRELVVNR